jgi:hypothetical protein
MGEDWEVRETERNRETENERERQMEMGNGGNRKMRIERDGGRERAVETQKENRREMRKRKEKRLWKGGMYEREARWALGWQREGIRRTELDPCNALHYTALGAGGGPWCSPAAGGRGARARACRRLHIRPVRACVRACVHVFVHVHACVHACMRVCTRVCQSAHLV